MIENDKQMKLTQECIELMQNSLDSLRKTVLPKSQVWYDIMAEGPLDELNKLQAEIDDYLVRKQLAPQKLKAKTPPKSQASKPKKKRGAQLQQG